MRLIQLLTTTLSVALLVQHVDSDTIHSQPSTGKATIIPGKPLYLECKKINKPEAEFRWYRRLPDGDNSTERAIEPENEDILAIHNDKLTLFKPNYRDAGDYVCRGLITDANGIKLPEEGEFAVIKVRSQPYIEDFKIPLSHTGSSTILTDGDRLELTCKVPEEFGPVNVSWHRSANAESDALMEEIETTTYLVSPMDSTNLSHQNHNHHNSLHSDVHSNQHGGSHSNNNNNNNIISPLNAHQAQPDHYPIVQEIDSRTKKLIIGSVRHQHRGYYTCLADNGVTERSRKLIYVRVKDKLAALWPFLGIVAEIFILLTIIQVWETQRAYRDLNNPTKTNTATTSTPKRTAPGSSRAGHESVPLTTSNY